MSDDAVLSPAWRERLRVCLGAGGSVALALGIGADFLRGSASLVMGPVQWALIAIALVLLWSADRMGRRRDPATSARDRLRIGRDGFVVVVACALLFGLIEVSVLAVRRNLLDQFTWAGHQYVWMTPVSWLVILLPIAIAFGTAGVALPRLVKPWMALLVTGFVGIAGLLLLYRRVHIVAALVLALGIAWRLAAGARRHPRRVIRWAGRSTPVLAGLVVVFGGLRMAAAGSARPAASTSALAPTAPNVLLIILDTVRASNLGLYGHDRPTTPHMERFASEGLTFERAISSSPWTLPAHATLFTGRYPQDLTADWRVPLDGAFPTLAEAFRDAGYDTGGFVANLFYTSRESGMARGFLHFEDYRPTWSQIFLSSNLGQQLRTLSGSRSARRFNDPKPGPMVTASFLEWLDGVPERPFFAFLNYFDAHQPYRFTAEHADRFNDGRELADRYDAAIAYLDEELGSLFDELRDRGVLDRTIIVVTSDHGEHLGEHGLTGHGNSLYRPLLHIPLVIRYPAGVPAGRVARPVTLRDLPATILDLADLDPVLGTSRSLATTWGGEAPTDTDGAEPLFAMVTQGINTPPHEPVTLGDMHALLRDGLHYIRNGDGREELYRFDADPLETTDLAGIAEWRGELTAFRRELSDVIGRMPR